MIENILNEAQLLLDGFIAIVPDMLLGLVIVVIFALLARLARNLVRRWAGKITTNASLTMLLGSIMYIVVLAIGVFIAFDILGLSTAITSLLAGAGIIGLALGFAFQDIASNFISGVSLSVKKPFNIGDVVSTNGFTGIVDAVDLRSTTVRTFDGRTVTIPNKDVFQSPLVNFGIHGRRRIDLSIGVSYGDDLEKAIEVCVQTVNSLEWTKEENVNAVYTGFGASSVDFLLTVWIDNDQTPGFLDARHEMIIAIKNKFDEQGISIPFPITTLDFGAKGGEALNTQLNNN